MRTLEQIHIETVEETMELLKTDDYKHQRLIGKLNRLIGYLLANEEILNPSEKTEQSEVNQC